ncbi:MAG: FAD-dependent oxidoreductase, partial [Planctomycetaceae bacterium]|nr:FAD-dependent oxidoreductase [Planctomycetaceae bacterium]
GLRPLVASSGKKSTAGLSREHEIVVSGSGMISIIGGKWTTYRRMGQDVIDLAQRTGDLPAGRKRSNTASLKLHAAPVDLEVLPETDHGINSLDPLVIYGTDAAFIRKLHSDQPELNQRLHPQFSHTAAEVIWCVRHEMARTVEDILARRTRMLFLNAQAAMEAADAVATLMQTELNQPATWKAEQIAAFQQTARTFSIGSS